MDSKGSSLPRVLGIEGAVDERVAEDFSTIIVGIHWTEQWNNKVINKYQFYKFLVHFSIALLLLLLNSISKYASLENNQ